MKSEQEIRLKLEELKLENNEEFGRILYEEAGELEAKIESLKWVLGELSDSDYSVGMNRYHDPANREKLRIAKANKNG